MGGFCPFSWSRLVPGKKNIDFGPLTFVTFLFTIYYVGETRAFARVTPTQDRVDTNSASCVSRLRKTRGSERVQESHERTKATRRRTKVKRATENWTHVFVC